MRCQPGRPAAMRLRSSITLVGRSRQPGQSMIRSHQERSSHERRRVTPSRSPPLRQVRCRRAGQPTGRQIVADPCIPGRDPGLVAAACGHVVVAGTQRIRDGAVPQGLVAPPHGPGNVLHEIAVSRRIAAVRAPPTERRPSLVANVAESPRRSTTRADAPPRATGRAIVHRDERETNRWEERGWRTLRRRLANLSS